MAVVRTGKALLVKILGLVVVVLIAAVVLGLIFRGTYETEQTAKRSFTIDKNFTVVRKILVQLDGAKKLVEMGGDTYLDQSWSQVGADLGGGPILNPNWRIELKGVLRVTTHDDYIGDQDIDLAQTVEITPDLLHSDVKLKEPAEKLRNYQLTTNFDRNEPAASGDAAAAPAGDATKAESAGSAGAAKGPTTRVELKLTEKIRTDAPWFAHGIADRRVRASVEKRLEHQEESIRKFVADNLDKVPLLPLR